MHHSRLHILSAAAVLALGFTHGAQAQSLLDLYQSARAYDATYQSAQAQAQATRAKSDQGKALILPTVGLGASYTHTTNETKNPISDSSNKQKGLGLNASIPLFDAANFKKYQSAKKAGDLADIQLHVAEQDLMVRTAQAYFDVLSAQDALKLARSQKEAMGQQLAFAKRNFEVGTATITDSREAQAAYDLASAQESAADFTLQTKNSALAQLVGKDAISPWVLVNPFSPPALENETVQYWQGLATGSDAVKASRVQYEMAKLDTSAARAGHLPTLTGSLSVSEGRQSPNVVPALSGDTRSHNTSAGLNLNIPIFAGFAIQNQVREKVALEDKARDDLAATERNTAQGTREAFFGVQSLKAQVNALEAAEKSSQSALEANKLGYEVGVRINIDVLNAQTQLYNTQSQLAQARYNLLTTQLKLKQAVGTLAVADLEKINAYLRTPNTAAAIAAVQNTSPSDARQSAANTPATALKPAANLNTNSKATKTGKAATSHKAGKKTAHPPVNKAPSSAAADTTAPAASQPAAAIAAPAGATGTGTATATPTAAPAPSKAPAPAPKAKAASKTSV
jgi:outer membrane protein